VVVTIAGRAVATAKRRVERLERITPLALCGDRMTTDPLAYPDTAEFHRAPLEQHWRSFVESKMSIMKKNLDLVE
jgi:hypothetical protein